MKMFRGQPLMADLGAGFIDEARQAWLDKNDGTVTAKRVDQLIRQIVWSLEHEYGEASKPKTNGQPETQPSEQHDQ